MQSHRRPFDRITVRTVFAGLAAFVMASFIIVTLAGASAQAGDLPRYKLTVGQELVYRTADAPKESEVRGTKVVTHSFTEWVVDVTGQNSDGSMQMLFRVTRTTSSKRGEQETKRDTTSEGYFALTPEGRLLENPTVGLQSDPTVLFPPLPADEASLKAGWSAKVGFDNSLRQLKAGDSPSEPGATFIFQEDPHTDFSVIYLRSVHRDYVFDRDKGLVTKVTTTTTDGRRKSDPVVQTIELVDTRRIEAGEIAALGDESARYFAAHAQYRKLMARAHADFPHAGELLDQAEAELKKVDDQLKLPAVRAMFESTLKEHAGSAKYATKNAEEFGKLLDKPSDDWKTTDLDDQPRSLEDYRGKVVLLDFWYRDCPWCIRAMPQLKQLVDEFPKDKFVLLGMNSDPKLDDALFVVDKMQLNYVSLKNGSRKDGIHTKYGIHGWPTLVILDAKGVIRTIHVGYSPNLREELGEKVRELLAETAN